MQTHIVPSSQQALVLPAQGAPALADLPTGHLSFRLGAEQYGIDILKVHEIRGYEAPTRLAGAPAFIRGVINLRGVIVPIVDLRLRFGLAEAELGPLTVVIILGLDKRTVGIVVDRVHDVIELDHAQVRPAPEIAGAMDVGCVQGLASVPAAEGQELLILLDIQRLMSGADMGLGAQTH